MSREIWRNIKNWPLHQVSNRGRIRALPNARIGKRTVRNIEICEPSLTGAGYLQIERTIAGRRSSALVHRLVLAAFRGPIPRGKQGRHLDGNRSNNRLANLRWGSQAENEADKIAHGRSNRGERHGMAILTARQARAIRDAIGPRGIGLKLAKRYGIAPKTVSDIRLRRLWKWLP